MPEPVKSRPYRSEVRTARAAGTRQAVLEAGRALFASHGWAGTTVAAVARAAGVSVDTVYSSVGRKPDLLLAVHDMALSGGDEPLPAEQRDYVRAVREASGARAKLEVYAAALGDRLPRTVPLAEALRSAGETDPACRRVHEHLEERRAQGMRRLAAELRATGELREDLDDEAVADLLRTMNSPPVYLLLSHGGAEPQRYVTAVTEVWTRTLVSSRRGSPTAPG